MEEPTFKKDNTPYLIFECAKCKQYLYVKTTQKRKKCLRCGHTQSISTIINNGEIVNGMTAAVDLVKRRQNEFAKKELGHIPEFRAYGDFKVATQKSKNLFIHNKDFSEETSSKFKELLNDISSTYKKFPLYLIEIIAENYGIAISELKDLIKTFQKQGILVPVDSFSFIVKL